MALTIDKIKTINIPINVSRKPDNYPPSSRGISLYNDSVNLYDAINLFMASAPPATLTIGEGLLGNGSVLSPLSWAGVNHTSALSGNGTVGSPLDVADKGISLSKLAQSGATLNQIIKWDGTNWVPANETGGATSFVPLIRELTINGVTYDLSQNRSWNITSMVYPSAGIPLSTGTGWGTSITNNSANWNTAYSWGNHALAEYLTSAAIGVTVQPYNASTVIDGSYVHTDNNYTTAEKSKLAGIQAGAEVNVNADWNATSGDAQILNKPIIPSSLNALTDVTIGTLNNGQILQYNGTTSQWENVSVTIGSGDMQKSVYDIDNDGIVDYAETISVDVRNNSSTDTLHRGTIVYLSGSTGNHPNAVKAQANTEVTSSGTFGVVINDIGPNTDGLVAAMGSLHNLDTRTAANGNPNPFTSDTLVDGDILWLDPNTAGYVTKTKPSAPNHAVFIGVVARTHPTSGRIVYKIQNGYEVEELHNVKITSPLSNNQVLRYNDSNSLWENKTLNFQTPLTLNTTPSSGAATLAGDGTLTIPNYTLSGLGGVPTTRTLTINGTSYDLSADRSWTVSTASALDDLTDVVVSSPTSGQVLSYNGTNWVNSTGGGGGGTPGGSTTQVQFNDAGSFGGAAGFTYDKTAFTNTGQLNIGAPSTPTGRLNIKGGGNDSTTVNTRLTDSGNTELLKVLDNGNTNIGTGFNWNNTNSRLGIGTSSPSSPLTIVGNGDVARLDGSAVGSRVTLVFAANAGSYSQIMASSGTAFYLSGGSSTDIGISPGAVDYHIFNKSGNVGIGTLSPSGRLNVRGANELSTSSALLVQNNATTPLTLLDIRNDGAATIGTFKVLANGGIAAAGSANTGPGVAMLVNATASTYGVALGYGATAGTHGVAIGYQSSATGNPSVAIGYQSSATGSNSVAIAKGTASGTSSVALGEYSISNAPFAFATGTGSYAYLDGQLSVAGGRISYSGTSQLSFTTKALQTGVVNSGGTYSFAGVKPINGTYSSGVSQVWFVTVDIIVGVKGKTTSVTEFNLSDFYCFSYKLAVTSNNNTGVQIVGTPQLLNTAGHSSMSTTSISFTVVSNQLVTSFTPPTWASGQANFNGVVSYTATELGIYGQTI